jgi:hypothetical protein
MDLVLLNGNTSRVRPLNVVDPVTITLLVSIGSKALDIFMNWRAQKKAKAQAHTEFMNQVYKIPGISQEHIVYIHQFAERDFEGAVNYVKRVIEDMIAQEEQRIAEEVDKLIESQQGTPSPPSTKSKIEQATRREVAQAIESGQVPNNLVEQIVQDVNNPTYLPAPTKDKPTSDEGMSTAAKIGLAAGAALVLFMLVKK